LLLSQKRGGYNGQEMSILASRLIRNLVMYHSNTCKRMGNNGITLVSEWMEMCHPIQRNINLSISPIEPSNETLISCYLPLNSCWNSDILSIAKKYAEEISMTITVPTDNDMITDFLNTSTENGVARIGDHYNEDHPNVSMQGEAMQTLSFLSSADSSWNKKCLEKASALVDLEDGVTTVDEALSKIKENKCGYGITTEISKKENISFLMSVINREKNGCWGQTKNISTKNLLLCHSLDAIASICRGTEGRLRLLKALGWGSTTTTTSTDQREENDESKKEIVESNDIYSSYSENISGVEYDSYRNLVRGIVSLVFAQKLSSRNTSNNNDNTSNNNDTIVTLQQQHRAVSCLFSLCKDETIESPKQDVHSDTICQVCIGEGVLVALICLLDLSFIDTPMKQGVNTKKCLLGKFTYSNIHGSYL
jgi:hypothetical protein